MPRLPRLIANPQPAVGVVTSALALLTVALGWRPQGATWGDVPPIGAALVLTLAIYAAYQYPVHLRTNTKVCMTEIPYFLLATLLPPALAATAAGIGVFAGEFSVHTQRSSRLSDMATEAGRRVLLVFLGAVIAHLATSGLPQALAYAGTAILLCGGDFLTFPLYLSRLGEERPLQMVPLVAREASWTQIVQYPMGLLGTYAATQALWTMLLLIVPTVLIYRSSKDSKELNEQTRRFLEDLADTVDLRDPYTGGHSRRVTEYSAGILRVLGVQGPELTLILSAARIHDIGKIAIPDGILNKPERLTAEERAIMETHPDQGADFLMRYPDFAHGVDIVRHHHESWDGTGYPGRLKGTKIPFGARVVAVADSYDAMTSDRPYRRGMPPERAAAILREGSGQQWEPRVVDAILRSIADRLEQPVSPPAGQLAAPESGMVVASAGVA